MDTDINALGQALDTTWGRSSTPKTSSYSVKLTLQGPDRIMASFAAVVNFGTQRQMIEMKRRYAEEAEAITNEAIKRVKATYKSLTGKALAAKRLVHEDGVEIINFNVHNPLRTAYFRRKTVFEVR